MTSMDKFLVASVMAGVAWARSAFQIDLGVDEPTAVAIVGAVTAGLVWLVPNK
jgi:hypothetical protein